MSVLVLQRLVSFLILYALYGEQDQSGDIHYLEFLAATIEAIGVMEVRIEIQDNKDANSTGSGRLSWLVMAPFPRCLKRVFAVSA